jgi:hypothetical protein
MAKKNEMALETSQPQAMVVHTKPQGFENIDIADLIIPRLRVLQGLSKAVADGIGRMGQFQNSLTEEVLGESVEVVLLGMHNAAVYFKTGEGMVCKSTNGVTSIRGDDCANCPFGEYHGKFKEDGTPPGCASVKEFPALIRSNLLEAPFPILISFMKTSYPVGKRLASMAFFTGKDIFAKSYVLGTEKKQNNKGTFANPTVKVGSSLNEEELQIAQKWFTIMRSATVKAHDDETVYTQEV